MSRYRMLSVAELVEPAHAARTTMDETALDSLVTSIRAVGILEPLLVRPLEDGRYEVVAGHRRLKAARIAPLAKVPCIDLERDTLSEAIKIHENLEREELSPSDEAIFYAELYERSGEDVDKVAELVKRTREHVEGRLNLLRGDKVVFESLAAGHISIGVALELNRMTHPDDRRFHLEYAERTGVTVSTARAWRVDANRRRELARPAPEETPAAQASSPDDVARQSLERRMFAGAAPWELDSSVEERPCALCQEKRPAWRMLKKHLCEGCATSLWPRIVATLQGRTE